MTRLLSVLAVFAVAVMVALSAAAAPLPELQLIDLGTLGGDQSEAVAINDSGQIVGNSDTPYDELARGSKPQIGGHNTRAFIWTQQDGMVDLGFPARRNSLAYDINDSGQVVADVGRRAFLWSREDGSVDLGSLGGGHSAAVAVNDSGQVVGISNTRDCSNSDFYLCEHAFFWSREGGMVDLGTFGGRSSWPHDINDSGQVVGTSDTPDCVYETWCHAFLWTREGGMIDLGTLGGRYSSASAINARGEIVGWSETRDGEDHPFLWTPTSGMVDLGTLGGRDSGASDINDSGQVSGTSELPNGDDRAFIWTKKGGMVNLGTLTPDGESGASAINNHGQVIGINNTPTVTVAHGGPMTVRTFSWTPTGGMLDLGTLGGREVMPWDINNNGQTVGWSWTGDASHAFLFTRTS